MNGWKLLLGTLARLVVLVAVSACSGSAPPVEVSSTPFKLGTFELEGRRFVGVVLGDSEVIDLATASEELPGSPSVSPPSDMKDLIARYEDGLRDQIREVIGSVEAAPEGSRPAYIHQLSALRVMPPIMYPLTMVNTAANYAEHDLEMASVRAGAPGQTVSTEGAALPGTESAPGIWERREDDWRWNPFMFLKSPAAVIAHGEAVQIPPGRSQIEWECELGLVIGRSASRVPLEEAEDHVFGYTLENDISDRGGRGDDRYGSDWLVTKSHDTFAPMGPFITPKEFLSDPRGLTVTFSLNGEVLQQGTTAQMVHNVFEQLVYASNILTLRPGDVIATGTPPGSGSARNPPLFLQPGDRMECTYEGVGTLSNPVEAGR